ncbi:MAG: transaldolase family protein [Atopobium sp.]|uniref:transaldolase family protein n=1 Tax=Atopobium sp. TaxID=1872650 RepID=UPI002A757FA0|nr:transaldolase family protein [Atopobium sp.]MDY2788000.1 transaldolase family protein [Atopobium sp.]MDY4523345.1 transaldolase family protein [Atopobium sp.]
MKFFIDTADLNDIEEAASWGILSGVTTNPSLYARTGGKLADFEDHMVKICKIVGEDIPVSAESTAETTEDMIAEGVRLASLAPNIVVKLPICEASLPATHELAKRGVRVNMTLIFSATQALLAARAGARYISPFVGRFDDIADDGLAQLETIVDAVKNYDYGYWEQEGGPEIITASVRTPNHVTQAALMAADIATVPFAALKKCVHHPLTDKGLEGFAADWAKVVAQA